MVSFRRIFRSALSPVIVTALCAAPGTLAAIEEPAQAGEHAPFVEGSKVDSPPVLAYSPNANGYLVAWRDRTSGDNNILAHLADADGRPKGSRIEVSVRRGAQIAPAVAYGGSVKKYLVVWNDNRDGADVHARFVRYTGIQSSHNLRLHLWST